MVCLELERERIACSYFFEITRCLELVNASVDVGEFDPVIPRDNVPSGVVFQVFWFNKPDVTEVHSPISVSYGETSLVSESNLCQESRDGSVWNRKKVAEDIVAHLHV